MDSQLRHQVEDFYYLEAELLDERKLREWFELLTEDIRYWMPLRHNTFERPESVNEELSQPGEAYYFDDNWQSLKIRVERAYSKIAWAEVPPSRTRHLITNVRIKNDTAAKLKPTPTFSSTARAWKATKTFLSARARIFCGARVIASR